MEVAREKDTVTYKGAPIRPSDDLSKETRIQKNEERLRNLQETFKPNYRGTGRRGKAKN